MKKFLFRATDEYLQTNMVLPTESDSKKGWINWGTDNIYAEYLDSLYKNVATLHSIIEGAGDYVCGNSVSVNDLIWNEKINDKGETLEDLVRNIARDLLKYGGFAINVVRNRMGKVGALHYIPFERLRSDEHNTEFWYSKNWNKTAGRVSTTKYPKYDKDRKDANSIYYYINDKTHTYPTPIWSASVKACEIEKMVNEYHLNSIANGFSASYMISFNNGIPDDAQADEIENDVIEKFTGSGNGGRVLLNFANDKEHSVECSKLETDDAGEKYKELIARSRQEIFTAFRANPNIFGLTTESLGFNSEEYDSTFKLFNRTTIRPLQKVITRSLGAILEKEVTIAPFTLEGDDKTITEE